MTKALVLYSGGLDSRLAVKILKAQGIEVIPVYFKLPFSCADIRIPFDEKIIEIDCTKGELFKEYMEMLRNPKNGFGTAMNPCPDCKIFMFKKSKKLMKELNCDFIATGEVLGERPMSQGGQWLKLTQEQSFVELLRPLSAKVLPETSFEKNKLVDREKLEGIQGRRRIRQIELANEFNLKYPSPGGGCILCEKEFAPKLNDLLNHKNNISSYELDSLKGYKHFRNNGKIVVGRNEKENKELKYLSEKINYQFFEYPGKGPSAIYENKNDLEIVEQIVESILNKNENFLEKYRIEVEILPAKRADMTLIFKFKKLLLKHENEVNPENLIYEEKLKNSEDIIKKYFNQENSFFYIAYYKRKAVGYIHFTLDEIKKTNTKIENDIKGYLQGLYVLEEYRNKSIGTKLLEVAENFFKEKNITFGLTTDNTGKNKKTVEFYLKRDFKIIKKENNTIYLIKIPSN